MERVTKYGKTSHENGVCCTHFMSKECKEVSGNCAYGCKWEEEAWSKLAAYEDTGLTPEQILAMDEEYAKMAKKLGEYKQKIENIERYLDKCKL